MQLVTSCLLPRLRLRRLLIVFKGSSNTSQALRDASVPRESPDALQQRIYLRSTGNPGDAFHMTNFRTFLLLRSYKTSHTFRCLVPSCRSDIRLAGALTDVRISLSGPAGAKLASCCRCDLGWICRKDVTEQGVTSCGMSRRL